MKISKIFNTTAAIVGYATMAVAAFTVAEALVMTIKDQRERREIASNINPIYYDKNMTMKDWMNEQSDDEMSNEY